MNDGYLNFMVPCLCKVATESRVVDCSDLEFRVKPNFLGTKQVLLTVSWNPGWAVEVSKICFKYIHDIY